MLEWSKLGERPLNFWVMQVSLSPHIPDGQTEQHVPSSSHGTWDIIPSGVFWLLPTQQEVLEWRLSIRRVLPWAAITLTMCSHWLGAGQEQCVQEGMNCWRLAAQWPFFREGILKQQTSRVATSLLQLLSVSVFICSCFKYIFLMFSNNYITFIVPKTNHKCTL